MELEAIRRGQMSLSNSTVSLRTFLISFKSLNVNSVPLYIH